MSFARNILTPVRLGMEKNQNLKREPSIPCDCSIKKSIKPLILYAKCFGLIPQSDFLFIKSSNGNNGRYLFRVRDLPGYLYTSFVLGIILTGVVICHLQPPQVFRRMSDDADKEEKGNLTKSVDYYANIIIVYEIKAFAAITLLLFPLCGTAILHLIQRIAHLDKVMKFEGQCDERRFGKRILLFLIVTFLGTFVAYAFYYIYEPGTAKMKMSYSDYCIVPIMVLAGTIIIIPSATLVFFLEALRLRLLHFKNVVESTLAPVCVPETSSYEYYEQLTKSSHEKMDFSSGSREFALQIEKLRLIFAEMSSIAREVSFIFGHHLVRDYLFSVTGIILHTYILIFPDDDEPIGKYIIIGILEAFLVLKLFILSYFAQHIRCFGSQSGRILNRVSLVRLHQDCTLQIQLFQSTTENYPMYISAAEFFKVDRSLLTSIIGAIATYVIILVQFKASEAGFSTQFDMIKGALNISEMSSGLPWTRT